MGKGDIGIVRRAFVFALAVVVTVIMCIWVGCAYVVYVAKGRPKRI